MIPKGKLIIIGEVADKQEEVPFERKKKAFEIGELIGNLLMKLKPKNKIFEVITTVDGEIDQTDISIIQAMQTLGMTCPEYIVYEGPGDVRETEYIERIKRSDAVFFTGNDAPVLSAALDHSELKKAILEKYRRDTHFMIAGRNVCSVFDLSRNCIIDTQFIRHGQFKKMAQAVLHNPGSIGIGLGEDAVLMVRKGNIVECLGAGNVTILDAHEILRAGIVEATDKVAVYMEHLIVHMLSAGRKYLLNERCFG